MGKSQQKQVKMGENRIKPKENCGNHGFAVDFTCSKVAL
jgi:hypothetical protein